MKIHTTNYQNTFITVAEDCPADHGTIPPDKGLQTVANLQYNILIGNPYRYTSDEVLFRVFAERNALSSEALPAAREAFFAKGQPCFRASPLTKRYGWGLHSDQRGKIALYGKETEAYRKLVHDRSLKVVKAMKSGRRG